MLTLEQLAGEPYDGPALARELAAFAARMRVDPGKQVALQVSCRELVAVLDGLPGSTLQERWTGFEWEVWPRWIADIDRPPRHRWTLGVCALIVARGARPTWPFLQATYTRAWIKRVPAGDPLARECGRLAVAIGEIGWASGPLHEKALKVGARILLVRGYQTLEQITETDLRAVPTGMTSGSDVLDAALCGLVVLGRSPQRGAARRSRGTRLTAAELVARSRVPERFREVQVLYLHSYEQRISDVYATVRHKHTSLEHLWCFIDERFPEVQSCQQVRPEHVRAFIPHAIARAREVQRRQPHADGSDTLTAHQWLVNVRCFFADVCTWATEPGSPFTGLAPPAVPLERHDLVGVGFEKSRRRQAARGAANILDLERGIGPLRALALRRHSDATDALTGPGIGARAQGAEVEAFWDWALLELLLQSGLRIEEACELTTLDVLKRRHTDGRAYYMLHVKPSKYDRARVIPIGDGLGHVIAQIIVHVKRFYGTDHVPECDYWNAAEKRPGPRAPYLLQGCRHPSAIAYAAIRSRLARLSKAAGITRSDGSPLVVRPHDCRRVFASEHLNNNTPIHVIQALLGHASIDTVMVYAKLYPSRLVEEYRKSVRATYTEHHGPTGAAPPTLQEWAQFSRDCGLRDMGTHLCALPTGEHCARGLVCLGCGHAQPKKSAAPVFRGMLISHRKALGTAVKTGEPAGQVAARELEIGRIQSALTRAEQLTGDVAEAIESAA